MLRDVPVNAGECSRLASIFQPRLEKLPILDTLLAQIVASSRA
jgi:hypothetical protein